MTKTFGLLAWFLAVSFSVAFAQSKNASLADDTFVRAALASGTQEIHQGGEYADSTDGRISAFATRMVKDHSEANTQLLALARQLDITVPNNTLPGSGTQEQPNGIQSPPVTGPGNSTTPQHYFQTQVADHQKAVALFERELREGSNPKVKAFAKSTLSVIQAHLALARKDLASTKH